MEAEAEEQLFIEVQMPQQRLYNGVPFPIMFSPNTSTTTPSPFSLIDFIEAIKSHKPRLQSLLHDAGAILFRGFPVNSASDFNDVVEAFGFEEYPYVGGAALRNKVVGRIFTANESPPDRKIPFHNEMSHVPEFPSKLFFFCEVEPGCGGETPIALSHMIYERMKETHPEFVQQLEEHGLIYLRVLPEDDDPSSAVGRGWKSTFLTEDKSVAEERAVERGMKLEWLEDGVKVVIGPVPAFKFDKTRQQKVWFNGMVAAYTGLQDARNDPAKSVMFGDGKPLPASIIYDCLKIHEEECVAIPWQKGDVLLLDNWVVVHSRRSFDPPRRILVSLCK
ncbi:hypothetical protein Ancab_029598 [Ancistrocladus abbreviatus]